MHGIAHTLLGEEFRKKTAGSINKQQSNVVVDTKSESGDEHQQDDEDGNQYDDSNTCHNESYFGRLIRFLMCPIYCIGTFISSLLKCIGWWGSVLAVIYILVCINMVWKAAIIYPCQFNGSTFLLENHNPAFRKDMVVFQGKPTFWENTCYMPVYLFWNFGLYIFYIPSFLCDIVYRVTGFSIQYTFTQEGICQMLAAWLIIHASLSLASIVLIKLKRGLKATDGQGDSGNKVSAMRMFPGMWLRDHVLFLDIILWMCFMRFCFVHTPLSCRTHALLFWSMVHGVFWGVVFHFQLQYVGAGGWKDYYSARASENKEKASEAQQLEQQIHGSQRKSVSELNGVPKHLMRRSTCAPTTDKHSAVPQYSAVPSSTVPSSTVPSSTVLHSQAGSPGGSGLHPWNVISTPVGLVKTTAIEAVYGLNVSMKKKMEYEPSADALLEYTRALAFQYKEDSTCSQDDVLAHEFNECLNAIESSVDHTQACGKLFSGDRFHTDVHEKVHEKVKFVLNSSLFSDEQWYCLLLRFYMMSQMGILTEEVMRKQKLMVLSHSCQDRESEVPRKKQRVENAQPAQVQEAQVPEAQLQEAIVKQITVKSTRKKSSLSVGTNRKK